MSAGRRAIYTCIPLNKINEVNKKVLSKTKIPLRDIMEAKFGIRYLVKAETRTVKWKHESGTAVNRPKVCFMNGTVMRAG